MKCNGAKTVYTLRAVTALVSILQQWYRKLNDGLCKVESALEHPPKLTNRRKF